MLVDKQGTGDVEEVKCNSIYDAAEYEHPDSATRVAGTEKAEPENPGKHCDEHHLLDAESLHADRDEKYAECLRNL